MVEPKKKKQDQVSKPQQKSFITCFKLSDLTTPVKDNSSSIISRLTIKTSPNCKQALLHSISDDTSSTSYYGASSLYFFDLMTGAFSKFSLVEGPINDFEWASNGAFFVVNAGHQPSKTYLYNYKCSIIKEICLSKSNIAKISPDCRLLCLAGFGSLHGEVDIFELSNFTQIGKLKFFCGASILWSADSYYILIAVLSPKMKMDNEYKIFTYNGDEVVGEKFTGEVYDCNWVNSGGK